MAETLLEVNDLKVRFATEDGIVSAVDGISFALELEGEPVDRTHDPVLGGEPDLEVVDLEQGLGHQVSRIMGSRYAYATSTSVEKTTMNAAP